jgi:serine/threonine protein kinase
METDLASILKTNQPLSSDHISLFTYQILRALKYIHSANIIHRDLKPENILLDRTRTVPRISDFGLARESAAAASEMRTYCGTPHYFAPEMFKLQRHEVAGYGPEVDLWSLGVILYVLLSARPPFADEDLASQVEGGRYDFECEEFAGISQEAKDLIVKLLERQADMRLTAEEAYNHPWIQR